MTSPGLIPRNRLAYIPKRLRRAHEYCFFLHDEVVRMLKEYEAERATVVKFRFSSGDQKKQFLEFAENEGTIAAMRAIGLEKQAKRVVINQITFAAVSDAFHHFYEALRCLEKRKVVVAFNLLRKPLLETFPMLCWILVDEDEFHHAFSEMGPEKIEAKAIGNRRQEILRRALALTAANDLIDADEIHQILFDSRGESRFYMLFQHAVHLVTTIRPEIATTKKNLNFIFKHPADDDIYEFTYYYLPSLFLFYALVVLNLFDRIKSMDRGTKTALNVRATYGYGLLQGKKSAESVLEILKSTFFENFSCPNCASKVNFTRNSALGLVLCDAYRCGRCRKSIPFPFSWMFD